jgi:photosystem II stability/assembly factor-like uncharacterized protein
MKKNIYSITGVLILILLAIIIWLGGDKAENVIYKPDTENNKIDKNRPSDWAWMQRVFPNNAADPLAQLDAIEEAKQLRIESKNKYLQKNKSIPQWEFAGPYNIGGRISDIEFNPNQTNIVYAAAATGGVFKSTNTGETWFPIFDDQAILPAGDIAVDPINSDIVYVGTGEPNGSHNNLPGAGMFKSTDAGITWNHLGLTNTSQIGRILIDPNNTQIIYTAAVGSNFSPTPDRGVYKSTDGGTSWDKVLFVSDSTGAIDIVLNPDNTSELLATMWQRVRRPGYGQSESSFGPQSGIFKSIDGGENWNKLGISNGLPADDSGIGRIGLAISPSNPSIVYSLYNDGGVISGFYKSTDFGGTWEKKDLGSDLLNGASSFSWYFGQVRVHPTNPETVYVLDVAFMRSTNSGNSFPLIYGYGGPSVLHVDHHALAFKPDNPNYLISGNDGGINISTDGGTNWSQPKYLPITQFYEIGLDYLKPERLYGGTQDNNTVRTTTGSIDDWEAILGGDGFYVIVDPTNSNIIYAESQWGNLAKSTNGGNSFFSAKNGIDFNEPTNWSTPVVMDPNNPQVLYYGTNRLYRTTNGANSWTAISSNLALNSPSTPRYGTLTTIAVAPSNSNVIYIGTDDSKVWVTTDLGSNWTDISTDLPFRWVSRVAVDPNNAAIVYAAFSGLKWGDAEPRLFRSINYGGNWSSINGNLPDAPINVFAIDNNNSDVLYVGNDVGVFYTTNLGTEWNALGEGMPIVSVYDMKIHPTDNYLAAGTHGRSMYKINLNEVTGVEVEKNETLPFEFELSQNYPNPFNPSTKIKFVIPENVESFGKTSHIQLKIYDILGNEITTLVNEQKQPGTYEVEFNASSVNRRISSGIYFYRLSAGNNSITKQMVLMK